MGLSESRLPKNINVFIIKFSIKMTIWSHLGVSMGILVSPILGFRKSPVENLLASVQGTTPSLEALKYLWSATVRATCTPESWGFGSELSTTRSQLAGEVVTPKLPPILFRKQSLSNCICANVFMVADLSPTCRVCLEDGVKPLRSRMPLATSLVPFDHDSQCKWEGMLDL